MGDIPDWWLASELKKGGTPACDAVMELFGRHQGLVFNFARRIVLDPETAEDAVQETFLSLIVHPPDERPGVKMSTYLLSLTRNFCLKHLRKTGARSLRTEEGRRATEPAASGASPSSAAEKREGTRALERVIRSLSPAGREAVSLRYFEHLSYEEMSQVLRVPANTAKTRVRAALEALRRSLRGFAR